MPQLQLPVFQHGEKDLRSFRMFTSQMIVTGTAQPKDIVRTFGVPRLTVKRGVKWYRERGAEGFFQAAVRKRTGRVLQGEVLKKAEALLSEGQRGPEVARGLGLKGGGRAQPLQVLRDLDARSADVAALWTAVSLSVQ